MGPSKDTSKEFGVYVCVSLCVPVCFSGNDDFAILRTKVSEIKNCDVAFNISQFPAFWPKETLFTNIYLIWLNLYFKNKCCFYYKMLMPSGKEMTLWIQKILGLAMYLPLWSLFSNYYLLI